MADPDLIAFEIARAAQAKALKQRKAARRKRLARTTRPPPQFSPTQHTGFNAEDQAQHYLSDQGLHILAKNLRCRSGEIDLVANDNGILVFVEVKYRAQPGFGGAAASVNRDKQARLIRSARFFLPALTRRFFAAVTPACRFDVVTLEAGGLTWIRHAFDA